MDKLIEPILARLTRQEKQDLIDYSIEHKLSMAAVVRAAIREKVARTDERTITLTPGQAYVFTMTWDRNNDPVRWTGQPTQDAEPEAES